MVFCFTVSKSQQKARQYHQRTIVNFSIDNVQSINDNSKQQYWHLWNIASLSLDQRSNESKCMCTHQRRGRRRRWRDLRILTGTLDENVALEFSFIQCYDRTSPSSTGHDALASPRVVSKQGNGQRWQMRVREFRYKINHAWISFIVLPDMAHDQL